MPIAITTTTLPSGNVGGMFTAALGAAGGTGTFAWCLDSGALPGGVTLSQDGSLAGTLTSMGTFTVILASIRTRTMRRRRR
jgi:hypothetical protein